MTSSRSDEELAALRCIFSDFEFEGDGKAAKMTRDGQRINLHLPPAYPDAAAPSVTVTAWPGLSRAVLDAACRSISSFVERQWEETRCEMLFAAIEHAITTCDAAVEAAEAAAAASATSGRVRLAPSRPALAWLWFHHIKSSRKKVLIQEWAAELGLWALCKPGWPGVIYCEGDEVGVGEFIKRLKSLQWQAIAVRDMRVLPVPAAAGEGAAGGNRGLAGASTATVTAAPDATGAEAAAAAAAPPAPTATAAAPTATATVPLASLGVLREPGALLLGDGDMHELSALCKRMGRESEFMTHIMRLASAAPSGAGAAAAGGSSGAEASSGSASAGRSVR